MKAVAWFMAGTAVLLALTAPVAAQDTLTVKVTLEPAGLYPGERLKITARTSPQALCTATIRFRFFTWTGRAQKANDTGEVVWVMSTEGRVPGVFPVTVHCVLGEQKAVGSTQLTVR
ncbi:MAG: hypothetical protein QN131_04970 [Armatimonadota bacterium]|nr:hypothetical protein [Armatimonadota bacterium]MDR7549277.1 hypothetical protein [Armatimonadota bacterium]